MRSILSRSWFLIALGGLVLFFLAGQTVRLTGNVNLVPTLLLLGAFVVPVSFAAYFYRQEHLLDRDIHGGVPLIQASVMFLIGGVVGIFIAGLLEYQTLGSMNFLDFVKVGLIEESAKLVFPVIVFLQGRYRSEADGLLFGVATGMGFAALETMGYGLAILMEPLSSLADLEMLLIIRGLLAPLGHAAWTGLICGAMWHYRDQGKAKLAVMTAAYFLLAVFLHFLWNTAASTGEPWITFPSIAAIGALSLFLVFGHLRDARRKASITVDKH